MIEELIAFLGLILVFSVGILGVGVYIVRTRRVVDAQIEREALARKNPFTTYDINFMVEAGMTPGQIEAAIKNAVGDLDYEVIRK